MFDRRAVQEQVADHTADRRPDVEVSSEGRATNSVPALNPLSFGSYTSPSSCSHCSAQVVMEVYVQRTHGTYIEQKGNELIWQFR